MRIVKTMKDIELLKGSLAVNEEIMKDIEEHFRHIYKNLGEEVTLEEFSLAEGGIIVLLEAGDNIADLEEIGLNAEDNGLLGAIPEWINEKVITEGTLIYACIVCNNEYALSIFLKKEDFDQKVENWIDENM